MESALVTVLRRGDRVGSVEDRDQVFAARLPDGPIIELNPVAALIWRTATEVPRDQIADHIAASTGAHVDEVSAATEALVEQLLANGLLVEPRIGDT